MGKEAIFFLPSSLVAKKRTQSDEDLSVRAGLPHPVFLVPSPVPEGVLMRTRTSRPDCSFT